MPRPSREQWSFSISKKFSISSQTLKTPQALFKVASMFQLLVSSYFQTVSMHKLQNIATAAISVDQCVGGRCVG